jgi:hypothetical protein
MFSKRRGPEPEQIELKAETCHLLQELLVEGDLLEVCLDLLPSTAAL